MNSGLFKKIYIHLPTNGIVLSENEGFYIDAGPHLFIGKDCGFHLCFDYSADSALQAIYKGETVKVRK